ncbi:nuclear transport factor 2 family protein [Chryseobacterium indologenes]|uniref:Nuclear transport factor 2 family protein n=1 Tax=Chryseobacterium oryzae TaxID=2929799 RepID=A0ABY4BGW3_9FLAO|nr:MULTISPECIES: nuclear transport factor 2 family protein [Chryseobacterium]AYZ35155.1 nuclear transport factor 2 family protein [Chryseobacterium indologenes]MEB4762913.1 nuclear transport factor 2 family protein [Chryseobacterium indologenes]OCK50401.1 ketosteroid isomerase [Chryseobacterium sp. CBo1]UEQ78097.1 nuclear transport factor 2 family protein [Chryseobacterium arthrosphaerae]UOE37502.1 nuclear transport factor 2 family protein [Chryseobacterium oryzae]
MNLKEILNEANACISTGNYDQFLTYCTIDTHWTFIGEASLTGIDEVRDYMKEAYIEPPRVKVDLMIQEGNYLTAVGKISIVNINSVWVEYEYCDVWRFENGKLAELKAFVVD